MKHHRRAVSLSLLMALALFVGILYVGNRDRSGFSERAEHLSLPKGMELQLRWLASGSLAEFEAVQDTFGFYTAALNQMALAYESHWDLGHIWLDPRQKPSSGYMVRAGMDFADALRRSVALDQMANAAHARLSSLSKASGRFSGIVDLTLSIPGGDGAVLELRQVAFELSLPTRAGIEALLDPHA